MQFLRNDFVGAAFVNKRGGFVFGTICLALAGCRSLDRSYTLDSGPRPLSPYAESELQRINGGCDDTVERCQSTVGANAWQAFVGGSWAGFSKEQLTKGWDAVKFVVFPEQGFQEPEALSYKVRLNLISAPSDAMYAGALAKTESGNWHARTCKAPAALPEGFQSHTVSYRLLTLDQPNLARNFIVLSHLGFWDGKELKGFRDFRGLFSFGSSPHDQDPYFLSADIYRTDVQPMASPAADTAAEIKTDGGRILGRAPNETYDAEANTPFIRVGALVGIAENPSAHTLGRQILGTKAAFALYRDQVEERADKLTENQTYPVVFGAPVDLDGTNRLSFALFKGEMSQYAPTRRYYIDCVEVLTPDREPWRLPGGRSIYLY
jgi:hypothetical protein